MAPVGYPIEMLYLSLHDIRCHEETNEIGADEPYVIVLSVDLVNTVKASGAEVMIPASSAFLWGPFGDVDAGETHEPTWRAFWGLNGEERALVQEDAIFIAAMVENDDGNADGARGLVASSAAATLLAQLGADRPTLVAKLIESTTSALKIPTGFPSYDETIGVQELRFEQIEIDVAERGEMVHRPLDFNGDGGRYTATFQAMNRGQAAWRFCVNCHAMYFDGFKTKGVCPNGPNGHVAAGFTFFLPHDRHVTPGFEGGWHFCNKCAVMFKPAVGFGHGSGNRGVCAATGSHTPQGYNFVLPLNGPTPGQDAWARCGRCRSLFWDGEANKGHCPAGGAHAHAVYQGTPVPSLKLAYEP